MKHGRLPLLALLLLTLCACQAPPQPPDVPPDVLTARVFVTQPYEEGQAWMLEEAAEQLDLQIHLTTYHSLPENPLADLETLIAQKQAPDIALITAGKLQTWLNESADYLEPLNTCVGQTPWAADMHPQLRQWLARPDDPFYGLPTGLEWWGILYSKQRLRDLGWSAEKIDQLPEQIRIGQFTLEEMAQWMDIAITNGVIERGYGLWFRFSRMATLTNPLYRSFGGQNFDSEGRLVISQTALEQALTYQALLSEKQYIHPNYTSGIRAGWGDRTAWRDAVAQHKVLFAVASVHDLATFFTYDQLGFSLGNDSEEFGYVMYPAGQTGFEPHIPMWNHYFYVVFREEYTGRANQEVACQLIAETMNPAIHGRHATANVGISLLQTSLTHPAYTSHLLTQENFYMLEHSWLNRLDMKAFSAYLKEMETASEEVQNGQDIQEVAARAVLKIETELGAIRQEERP